MSDQIDRGDQFIEDDGQLFVFESIFDIQNILNDENVTNDQALQDADASNLIEDHFKKQHRERLRLKKEIMKKLEQMTTYGHCDHEHCYEMNFKNVRRSLRQLISRFKIKCRQDNVSIKMKLLTAESSHEKEYDDVAFNYGVKLVKVLKTIERAIEKLKAKKIQDSGIIWNWSHVYEKIDYAMNYKNFFEIRTQVNQEIQS